MSMLVNRAHKIRIYPTKPQEEFLLKSCGSAKFIYNLFLGYLKDKYEHQKRFDYKVKINWAELSASIPYIKDVYPWVSEVQSASITATLDDLKTAYNNFFRNLKQNPKMAGFPKFKNKFSHKSFYLHNTNGIKKINGKRIKLSKVGWVKMAESLRFDGKIMSGTISQDGDRWFISISSQINLPEQKVPERVIGIDRGVTHAIATNSSEEPFFDSPRPYKKMERKLQIAQRQLSKLATLAKERGVKLEDAKNYQKQKLKVNKIHSKIKNTRENFTHETTTKIVKLGNLIKIENLNIKGMTKNHCLSKHILDNNWFELQRQLEYKTQLTGGKVEKVNAAYTSQKCSKCGNIEKENRNGGKFKCLQCGFELDADINAAYNIAGVNYTEGALGEGLRRKGCSRTPVEAVRFGGDANHAQP